MKAGLVGKFRPQAAIISGSIAFSRVSRLDLAVAAGTTRRQTIHAWRIV
jgi:hypothetical protein